MTFLILFLKYSILIKISVGLILITLVIYHKTFFQPEIICSGLKASWC